MVDYTRVMPDGDPPGWPSPLYPNPKSSLKCKIAQQCLAQIDAIIALIQTAEASNANSPAPPLSDPIPPVAPSAASDPPALPPPSDLNPTTMVPALTSSPLALPPYTIPSIAAWQHEHLCLYRWMSFTGTGELGDGTDKELDNAAAAMKCHGDRARMQLSSTRRALLDLLKDLDETLHEMRAARSGELTIEHESWLEHEPFGLVDLKTDSHVRRVHVWISALFRLTGGIDDFTPGFVPEIGPADEEEKELLEMAEDPRAWRERRERRNEDMRVKWERYHEAMGEESSDDDDYEYEEDEEDEVDAINRAKVAEEEFEAKKAKEAAEKEEWWKPGLEELDRETYEAIREEEARKRAVIDERFIQNYDTQLQFWNEGRYECVDITDTIPQLWRRKIEVVELDAEGNEMGPFKGPIEHDLKLMQGRRFWRKGTESQVSCGTAKRNHISVVVRVPVPGCWRMESREPGEVERLWQAMRYPNMYEGLGF